MGEILQNWLTTRLGIVLDTDPFYFGSHVADGTLLAQLLHSYGIINAEQVNTIVSSPNPSVRFRNLVNLQVWLKFIGIECHQSTLMEISNEKGSAAIQLFYEIFLSLENKHRSYFITQQQQREAYGAFVSKFQVMKVPESAVGYRDPDTFNPLAAPLVKKKDMVDWYRERCQCIIDKCKAARKRYAEALLAQETGIELFEGHSINRRRSNEKSIEKDEVILLAYDSKYDDKELTFRDLIELQTFGQSLPPVYTISPEDSKTFVSFIKKRSRKDAAHKEFKFQMQEMILTKLWDNLMESKEKEFNTVVSKKLLKQSQYEKQMANKLYSIRHEKKLIIEDRLYVDNLELREREDEVLAAYNRNRSAIEKEKVNREINREMNFELHRRLYREKLQLKYEKHYGMCMDVMTSFVDIAIRASEFRSVNSVNVIPPIMWGEWKALFLASQPIFGEQEGAREETSETQLEDIEIVSEAEQERQNALDDYDFNEYLYVVGPWFLEDVYPELEGGEGSLNVLGYIVHRLLNLKYPLPLPPVPPDLPSVSVAAAVVGLNDDRVIAVLRELFMKQEICVIQLETVINYCLEAYKKEMADKYNIDLTLIQSTKAAVEESRSKKSDKKKPKNKKKTAPKSASKTVAQSDNKTDEPPESDASNLEKGTQTPRNIPEDDEDQSGLTLPASLGKQAFEILGLGEQVDDSLLMKMFVEYLKENRDIKGWVIFNYPMSYAQATFLEESLSGIKLPPETEEIETMETIEEIVQREICTDTSCDEPEMDLRVSRLVPNPIPKPILESPKTYLTSYISIKKNKMQPESEVTEEEQINDEEVEICDENVTPLEAFYIDQLVSYSFYYEVFDFRTIKQLARIIMRDVQVPPTPSIDLFGDVVEELATRLSGEGKRTKPSSSKKKVGSKKSKPLVDKAGPSGENVGTESERDKELISDEEKKEKKKEEKSLKNSKGKQSAKGKSGKKGKKGQSVPDEDETKEKNKSEEIFVEVTESAPDGTVPGPPPSVTESLLDTGERIRISVPPMETEPPKPPKPGEEEWEYINVDIPEPMYLCLSTLWENLENIYLTDFKQLFFMKRTHYGLILPYFNFVREHIKCFIRRPDNKQQLLNDFQTKYNNINEDLRQDVEMKSELHCRISEFQNILWDICDQRKREAESERRLIVNENWVAEEMGVLTNIFICAIQLEVDRCVDTLQLIHDYYLSMLMKLPSKTRLDKVQVARLELSETENTSDSSVASQRRRKSISSRIVHGVGFKETIAKMLVDLETSKPTTSPFHDVISDSVRKILSVVDQLHTDYQRTISKEDEMLNPKVPAKGNKQKKKQNSKRGHEQPAQEDAEAKQLEVIKGMSKQLFEEWLEAVHSETARMEFRLKLIKERALVELSDLQESAQDLFSSLHEEIANRYEREVKSVNVLCKLLRDATEGETPIQAELVLDQDEFYIYPNALMYPDPPKPPPPPVEERILDYEFRIGQLGKLMEKLTLMSPGGLMPERALVYMLEDMVVCGTDEGGRQCLPKIWYKLTTEDIPIVIKIIYGEDIYVDWKDFLIYGLNLSFPTMEEILDMRHQFKTIDHNCTEVITHEDYHKIRLWYEKHIPDDPQLRLRGNMTKELLFTLFQVKEDATNYTALLLYFCKDKDPRRGVGKALALCLGNMVLVSTDEYSAYTIQEEEKLKIDEEMRKNAEGTAAYVLTDILGDTIQQVAGVVITEVTSSVSNNTENNYLKTASKELVKDSSKGSNSLSKGSGEQDDVRSSELPRSSKTYDSKTSTDFTNEKHLCRVSLDVLLTVFTVSLPWYIQQSEFLEGGLSFVQALAKAFNELLPEDDTVLIHEFLEHGFMDEVVSRTHKFKSLNMAEVVEDVLMTRGFEEATEGVI